MAQSSENQRHGFILKTVAGVFLAATTVAVGFVQFRGTNAQSTPAAAQNALAGTAQPIERPSVQTLPYSDNLLSMLPSLPADILVQVLDHPNVEWEALDPSAPWADNIAEIIQNATPPEDFMPLPDGCYVMQKLVLNDHTIAEVILDPELLDRWQAGETDTLELSVKTMEFEKGEWISKTQKVEAGNLSSSLASLAEGKGSDLYPMGDNPSVASVYQSKSGKTISQQDWLAGGRDAAPQYVDRDSKPNRVNIHPSNGPRDPQVSMYYVDPASSGASVRLKDQTISALAFDREGKPRMFMHVTDPNGASDILSESAASWEGNESEDLRVAPPGVDQQTYLQYYMRAQQLLAQKTK